MKKILVVLIMLMIVGLFAETTLIDTVHRGYDGDITFYPNWKSEEEIVEIYELQDKGMISRIDGETISRVIYYADGDGGVISTVTVYADTIIVANPNAVIILEKK